MRSFTVPPSALAGLASLGRVAAAVARDVEAFALPQRCPGCGDAADPAVLLCAACLARIPRLSFALCASCLSRGAEPAGCARHPRHRVWPALVYDERAALLVHAFKYGARPRLAPALAALLAEALPRALPVDVVTNLPLHPARRRERGYDQAWLLADRLAARLGAPAVAGVLERTRPTAAQARLSPESRRRNVAGAFRVVEPARWSGRDVLVVDDVITTGATFEAALGALAAAGARTAGAALAWAQ